MHDIATNFFSDSAGGGHLFQHDKMGQLDQLVDANNVPAAALYEALLSEDASFQRLSEYLERNYPSPDVVIAIGLSLLKAGNTKKFCEMAMDWGLYAEPGKRIFELLSLGALLSKNLTLAAMGAACIAKVRAVNFDFASIFLDIYRREYAVSGSKPVGVLLAVNGHMLTACIQTVDSALGIDKSEIEIVINDHVNIGNMVIVAEFRNKDAFYHLVNITTERNFVSNDIIQCVGDWEIVGLPFSSRLCDSLLVKKKIRFLEKDARSVMENTVPRADLIIPIFNREDCLRKLLRSLALNTNRDNVGKIFLVDDASNRSPRRTIDDELLDSGFNYEVITLDKNQGFRGAVEEGFRSVTAEFFILINTDTACPPNWIERLLAPFTASDVAIASPFSNNASNLSFLLDAGTDWQDADRSLEDVAPSWPDVITPVGFCMAIRTSAISGSLFSPDYRHGYGEETDLHYRLTEAGWRSVLCDNLLVFHQGSASYNLVKKLKEDSIGENRKLFFKRWGRQHVLRSVAFANRWSQAKSRINIAKSNIVNLNRYRNLDALFILPSNDRRIGGVNIVFNYVEDLILLGLKVKLLCLKETVPFTIHKNDGFVPSFEPASILNDHDSIGAVFATSVDTHLYAKQFADIYGARTAILLQGNEVYFDGGIHARAYYDSITQSDFVVAVSAHLADKAAQIRRSNCGVVSLSLGPDTDIFFEEEDASREKLAVFFASTKHPKGSGIATSIAYHLQRLGYRIETFGDQRDSVATSWGFDKHHNFLPPDELRKLFSKARYYLDFSWYEGLGLLPLQAAACGCVPVMSLKGATETFFEGGGAAVICEPHSEFETATKLVNLVDDEWQLRSRRCLDVGVITNYCSSVRRFADFFENNLKKVVDHGA